MVQDVVDEASVNWLELMLLVCQDTGFSLDIDPIESELSLRFLREIS